MLNCLFYSIFFSLFLSLSFGSLRFSQINRSFLTIYRGIFEASVITVDSYGEPVKPFFDRERLKSYVNEYFDQNLPRFTDNYTVEIKFFKDVSEKIAIESDVSRKVNITVKASINYLYKYDKNQNFTVIGSSEL